MKSKVRNLAVGAFVGITTAVAFATGANAVPPSPPAADEAAQEAAGALSNGLVDGIVSILPYVVPLLVLVTVIGYVWSMLGARKKAR